MSTDDFLYRGHQVVVKVEILGNGNGTWRYAVGGRGGAYSEQLGHVDESTMAVEAKAAAKRQIDEAEGSILEQWGDYTIEVSTRSDLNAEALDLHPAAYKVWKSGALVMNGRSDANYATRGLATAAAIQLAKADIKGYLDGPFPAE